MSPSRDEDLDWLYGRERTPRDEPEPTRVMPSAGAGGPDSPDDRWSRPDRGARDGHDSYGARPAGRDGARPGGGFDGPPTAQQPPVTASGQPALGPRAARRQGLTGPGGAGPGTPGGPGGPGGPAGPGGAGVPAGAATPRRRKHPVRRFFGVLGVVVALCLVWLIGVPIYAWSQVNRVANDPSGSRPADQPGYTFLLLGSDSRAGLTKAEQNKLGTGHAAGQRTDTIMILYVPPGGKPALISIPRDSYLPIPGHGSNKINAAYAFGGPKLITQTVEKNTGLRIDGYVEVGFGGFVNVIDSLGGIRLCLDKAVKDKDSHIDLKAGCQTLQGADALGYVRQRHADPLGDLGRVQRQRQMLSAMVKKAASPASVINPVRYWQLSNAGAQALTLGESTSAWETLHFVLGMKAVSAGDGYTLTVPVSNPNASTAAGSAVLWDDSAAKAMFGDLARGDTSNLKKYQK